MIYGTKRVNGSKGHIKVAQGLTTKIFKYYVKDQYVKCVITHSDVKPIIFRNYYKNMIIQEWKASKSGK